MPLAQHAQPAMVTRDSGKGLCSSKSLSGCRHLPHIEGHKQRLKIVKERCFARPGSSQAWQMQAPRLMLRWLPWEGPSWTLQDLALQQGAGQSRRDPLFKV